MDIPAVVTFMLILSVVATGATIAWGINTVESGVQPEFFPTNDTTNFESHTLDEMGNYVDDYSEGNIIDFAMLSLTMMVNSLKFFAETMFRMPGMFYGLWNMFLGVFGVPDFLKMVISVVAMFSVIYLVIQMLSGRQSKGMVGGQS